MKLFLSVLFVSVSTFAFGAEATQQPQATAQDIATQANGVITELKRERDEAQNALTNYAATVAVLQAQLAQAKQTAQPTPKK